MEHCHLPIIYFDHPSRTKSPRKIVEDESSMQSFALQIVGAGELGRDTEFVLPYRKAYNPRGLTKKQHQRAKDIAKAIVSEGADRAYFRHRMKAWLAGDYETGYEKYPIMLRAIMLDVPIALFPYANPMPKRNLLLEAHILFGERTLHQLRHIQLARLSLKIGDRSSARDHLRVLWGPTARAAESNLDSAELFLEWLHVRTGSSWAKRHSLIEIGSKDDAISLWERAGRQCEYCHSPLRKNQIHIDHIQPVAYAGMDYPENWAIACKQCNLSKGAELLSTWRPKFLPINFSGEEHWSRFAGPILYRSNDWYTLEW